MADVLIQDIGISVNWQVLYLKKIWMKWACGIDLIPIY